NPTGPGGQFYSGDRRPKGVTFQSALTIGGVTLIHRGKSRSLTRSQRRWLKRRQAVEPAIGHAKHDHGMKRCWLKGAEGDALHAVLCAAGFNIRWLLRAIARRGIAPAFLRSLWLLS